MYMYMFIRVHYMLILGTVAYMTRQQLSCATQPESGSATAEETPQEGTHTTMYVRVSRHMYTAHVHVCTYTQYWPMYVTTDCQLVVRTGGKSTGGKISIERKNAWVATGNQTQGLRP